MVTLVVEYCNSCGNVGRYNELRKVVLRKVPETNVFGTEGRRGSFEVEVNKILIHSKLKTLSYPDYNEVADIVEDAANGRPIRQTKKKQSINCCIM